MCVRVYIYTHNAYMCYSCRATSLWGCLLAELGDEPDGGWPQTTARGFVQTTILTGCRLRSSPLGKIANKPARQAARRSSRDLITDIPRLFVPTGSRPSHSGAARCTTTERGCPGEIPFADEGRRSRIPLWRKFFDSNST